MWLAVAFALPVGAISFGEQTDVLAQRARAATDTLMVHLLGRLTEEYSKGGAVRGVEICSKVAQDLTTAVGRQEGVTIRRVSLKTRNPRNTPDRWERSVLQRWERDARAGKQPAEVAIIHTNNSGQRTFRYMRPIKLTMPLCLECHGTTVKPEILQLIRERYPADKAIGYRLGDLRGAFSVTIPLLTASPPAPEQ